MTAGNQAVAAARDTTNPITVYDSNLDGTCSAFNVTVTTDDTMVKVNVEPLHRAGEWYELTDSKDFINRTGNIKKVRVASNAVDTSVRCGITAK